jgi:xanthine/uracil/vitamin C permease (AzgA family)
MTSPIDHTDTHVPDPQALRLAKLLDLRTFIGALFLIFGVVVTIEGLRATPASIAKAAGVNLSLWTGLSMLVIALIFFVWMLVRPPSLDVKHEDLSHAPERGHH